MEYECKYFWDSSPSFGTIITERDIKDCFETLKNMPETKPLTWEQMQEIYNNPPIFGEI